MASSRFPGKPLKPLLSMPLILHVWNRCRLWPGFERVVVATCDEEIKAAIETAGGEAVMTADTHERCTDRTEEAVDKLNLGLADDDLVLMVQGDEILVTPDMLGQIASVYEKTKAPVVNLISAILTVEDQEDPNVVKLVIAPDGRALYFSRAPIPSRARTKTLPPMWQQTGVIAFSAAFVKEFSRLEPTPLEVIESVDMMRVLEHGRPIQTVAVPFETIGVDTPADRDRAEKVLSDDPVTRRYLK
jgi:3-deoxy-manno-octulosonate cytidylyltransferase (CMP-KDO synthetase)